MDQPRGREYALAMVPVFHDLSAAPALLLIVAVVAVGILHTLVPDHWVPIAMLARQHGWSRAETARAAAQAGVGHVVSTLAIGVVIWLLGVATAQRFGGVADTVSSLALMGFGGWFVVMGLLELRRAHGAHGHGHGHHHSHHHDHAHGDDHDHHGHAHDHGDTGGGGTTIRHTHLHRHEARPPHVHVHAHAYATAHAITPAMALDPPLHDHTHRATGRGALLLILGSSPMIEGVPAFFAAGRFGVGIIALMALLFAASTIATYVVLCTLSARSLERVRLGPFERYGEVLSGGFIVLVGLIFWVWPVL
jgi:nickel/cobalt transporter (NicO) family protein